MTSVLIVRAPHMTVVGSMRGKRFATVFTFERLLSRMLANVSTQDAGGGKCL